MNPSGFTFFHTGMIVPRLDDAMAKMSASFGFTWAPPITVSGGIKTPSGRGTRTTQVTYSIQGPHRVELLEHVDDTAWREAATTVHHLGFAVNDLDIASKRLTSSGHSLEFATEGADGRPVACYFMPDYGGLWIELLREDVYRDLLGWIETGEPPNVAADSDSVDQ